MNQIKNSVKNFYNAQAEKFSGTRKKQWPEFFYIQEEVRKIINQKWKIKILELGCGDGRLYRYLLDVFGSENIDYTGVDISEWLINIAKNETKWLIDDSEWLNNKDELSVIEKDSLSSKFSALKVSFIVSDMLDFLEKQDQQSYDFVIAVASFQHIPKKYERLLILKNIYRILDYDGVVQMFNWSFSTWFFKKYSTQILKAFLVWILSLFTKPMNDIYVPWKNDWKVFYRYYHIFFLYELKNLFKQAGFVIKDICYINNEWNKSVSWKQARNSMIVAKKTVTKNI